MRDLYRYNPEWKYMYHTTPTGKRDMILREGLKVDQPFNLTAAGSWALDHYELNPIYLSKNPWPDRSTATSWKGNFLHLSDEDPLEHILLKIDVTSLELVADLPSLVDEGAYTEEEGLWWKRGLPPLLEPFIDEDEIIYYEDLLIPNHPVAEAAIEVISAVVYLPGPRRLQAEHYYPSDEYLAAVEKTIFSFWDRDECQDSLTDALDEAS